ncbi:hypothetical protein ENUP19_0156G0015 [Entamoeba nuttalli]|uniref:mRNA capping enzyme, beta chain protein n=2 Tax=Entamoeba nuttalli TaxID=412467 RepID=K2GVA4_ENTNP|nr:mRNA capping enzyme, beta chain protein [Entamoeba nuttalli P19]EKE37752.1 mRNA capping enzyme, beta chain protein [Entamoeba nuttalli P19]|eukprot:XP_008859910.1 mRNA capping enzyme, beta chain protein [Entamoeba nuttalli P19]
MTDDGLTPEQEQAIEKYSKMLETIKYNTQSNSSIEVESRIGIFDNDHKFISGVKQEEFYIVLNYMQQLNLTHKKSHEIEKIYQKGERGNLRYVTGKDREFIRLELKEKSKTEELQLGSSFDYSLRIQVSRETLLNLEEYKELGDAYITREKSRIEFVWVPEIVIDFTHVYQVDGKNKGKESFEIEFEFKSEEIKKILDNRASVRNIIKEYMYCVNRIYNLLKRSHGNYFGDIEQKQEHKLTNVLGRLICDSIEGADGSVNNFPGAMPVNFGRTSFDIIQKNAYIVSEKTDGVRHFVLVTENKVYLVTRKMEFFIVDFPEMVKAYGENGVSLFDGEIVRNIRTVRPVLMLFDAIIVDGINISKKKYSERIQKIEEIVERVDNNEIQAKNRPFDIIIKKFYTKEEINSIFQLICFSHEIGSYIIQDDIRCHRSDGIIFAPDIEYKPFANSGLFKWKYMTHWTIDYGITTSKNGDDTFYCSDGRKEVLLRKVNFSKEDLKHFEDDKAIYRWNGSGVVETSLDVWSGQWKYHIYRYDKPKPNNISVCIDTLEAMACNISREELIYRCSVKPEEDQWETAYKEQLYIEKKKLFEAYTRPK